MRALIRRLSQEEMLPALARRLQPRVERLGYLGEFFQCAAHQPKALLSFMALTDDLKEVLPDRLTEVVALTVSRLMANDYERVQHERLSLKLGFGKDWVRRIEALRPNEGEPALQDDEGAVQRLTMAVLERKGHNTEPELEAVVQSVGPELAVAILMLIGRYVSHSLMANALRLPAPVPSPLEEP